MLFENNKCKNLTIWPLKELSPKRGVGENTINQIYKYAKENKICLEDLIVKLIEIDQLKPKIKNLINF